MGRKETFPSVCLEESFYYLETLSRGVKKVSRKHGMQGEENKWIPVVSFKVAGFEMHFHGSVEKKNSGRSISNLLVWSEISIVDYLGQNFSPKVCPSWWGSVRAIAVWCIFPATQMLLFLLFLPSFFGRCYSTCFSYPLELGSTRRSLLDVGPTAARDERFECE